MKTPFVHLQLHTEYSIVDSVLRISQTLSAARTLKIPALALTDKMNLFGAVKFYRAALAQGIKPILGVDAVMAPFESGGRPTRVTLFCQNQTGYLLVSKWISRAYRERDANGGVPLLQRAWFSENTDGVIVLSGGWAGDIGQAILSKDTSTAEELLTFWKKHFPERFYISLSRVGRPEETLYDPVVLDLSERTKTPVVAVNDVCFLKPEDFEAHEARVCINSGNVLNDPKRPHLYTDQQYLKSADEMIALFADVPSAISNTLEIAQRCNLQLSLGNTSLPNFPVPEGMTEASFLEADATEGLRQRLKKSHGIDSDHQSAIDAFPNSDAVWILPYAERLKTELKVINRMGFAGYFLIVSDFIRWAKKNGVPVGPGRGSGAGSIVAYALEITDLDPLKYELLFERFLNPERVSMPDFDIDFCMLGRDRVIEYVSQKYGRDSVSQIITYGTMAAKAVVRDVGRVLGLPYGFVDKIAKLIPFELGITLEKAIHQEAELRKRYEQEDDVRLLLDLAKKLEGVARNAGKHAGGVVIAPAPLETFTPIYCESGSDQIVSQFDKDDVEAVGLVKFDFLGLRTLTVIHHAVRLINEDSAKKFEPPLDITSIPLDDEPTFDLLRACQSTAVFQLESRGMKELMKRLRPDSFEEIIALVALFRPGPLQSGMVEDFINRKHGRAEVVYAHPDVAHILQPTYGVILYQEQVMQIAQVLAGYTLGAADVLRRAMGKKKPSEMAKQRIIFVQGAEKRNVAPQVASEIFDLMEKFAGYGFNKSHSAAYALLSYQTGWLKAHYPAQFMAAVLSSEMDHTDKLSGIMDECKSMGLSVLPPDVNESMEEFTVTTNGHLRYGLAAVKGVGQAAIESILLARNSAPFNDLLDLAKRVDLRKVNKRVFEALVRSGACDLLGAHRGLLWTQLPHVVHAAEQYSTQMSSGQVDLFGATHSEAVVHLPQVAPEWTPEQHWRGEKETLGRYFSGHPIDIVENELRPLCPAQLTEIVPDEKTVRIMGLVVAVKTMFTKRGDRIAFVTIEDHSGRMDIAIFKECYERARHFLVKEAFLIMEGVASVDDYTGGVRFVAEQVWDVDSFRKDFMRTLEITLSSNISPQQLTHLSEILSPCIGGLCEMQVCYQHVEHTAVLVLGPEWRVNPSSALLNALRSTYGADCVSTIY